MQFYTPELTINLKIIQQNYLYLRSLTEAYIAPVLKANAYGVGSKEVGLMLEKNCNCNLFFVFYLEEALELRKHISHKSKIYFLYGITNNEEAKISYYSNVIPVLNSKYQAYIWSKLGQSLSRALPCIIHLETGMNRYAINEKEIPQILELTNINIDYIMSHLASADEIDNPHNNLQINNFLKISKFFPGKKRSLGNSKSLLTLSKDFHFDMIRTGIGIYGLSTIMKHKKQLLNPFQLSTTILAINILQPGSSIGYNNTYITKNTIKVGTISFGYADGYKKSLGNKSHVLINNKKAPIIGSISMDLINIDITDFTDEEAYIGQKVYLINNNLTADHLAKLANTSYYDIITSITAGRARKKYVYE